MNLNAYILHSPNLRRHFIAGWYILPVQVESTEAASVVANNYTIRVQHWHHFKDVTIPEMFGLSVITSQELKQSLHYEWTVCFSRVYSCT